MSESDPSAEGRETEKATDTSFENVDKNRKTATSSRRRVLESMTAGGALLLAGCGGRNPGTSTGGQDTTVQNTPTATESTPTPSGLAHVSGQTLRTDINNTASETTLYNRPSLMWDSTLSSIIREAKLAGSGARLQRFIREPGVWADSVFPGAGAQTYYNWIEDPIEISPTEVKIRIADEGKWSDGHQITGKDIATIPLQQAIQKAIPPYYADDNERAPQNLYLAIDDFEVGEQSVTYRSSAGHFGGFWDLNIRKRFGVFKGPHLMATHIKPFDDYSDAVIETARRAMNGEIDPWSKNSGDPHKQSLVDEHLMDVAYAKKFNKPENVLATGAWNPIEFTDEKFVFEKNEHHRNADSINFDRFELMTVTSTQRGHAALKADTLDYYSTAHKESVPQSVVESLPDNLEQLLVPGGLFTGTEMALNMRGNPLKHREVRAAIMYALDHRELANTIQPSAAKPITNPGGDCWDAPERVGQEWIDNNLISYAQDTEKAANLMRKAGFTKDGTQWMRPNGEPFTLTFSTDKENPTWPPVLVAQLSEFGIETTVKTLGGGAFWDRRSNGELTLWSSLNNSLTNVAPASLIVWEATLRWPRMYGIYPDEQFDTGEFNEGGVPWPRTEERWSVFTVEAPPIGQPDGPLQEYHPAVLSLSTYTNPPLEEYQQRLKKGLWLANWFLPAIPISKKLEQHFVDEAHWLWPKDSPSWQAISEGGTKQRGGLFASGTIQANPDNPEQGASVDE